jgi:hypothetical protein
MMMTVERHAQIITLIPARWHVLGPAKPDRVPDMTGAVKSYFIGCIFGETLRVDRSDRTIARLPNASS